MNVVTINGTVHGHCHANTTVSCICDVPEPISTSGPDPCIPAVDCRHPKCAGNNDDYCQNSRPGFPGNCHVDIKVACSCSAENLRG